jgi:MFS family permease
MLSAFYAPVVIAMLGARRSIAISMGLLAICMTLAPLSPGIKVAVIVFIIMGSCRGVSSVAMNTTLMEQVPKHFMGRVQNTFYFAGLLLQIALALVVGAVAQYNLIAGFAIIGMVYAVSFLSAIWPVKSSSNVATIQSA